MTNLISPRSAILTLSEVSLKLSGNTFGPFSIQVHAGERIAVLGPSGAGKSTLLKLMSGEFKPESGQVFFQGRALLDWHLKELSQKRAVLPQSNQVAFGFQARLVIALGRVSREFDPGQAEVVRAAAKLACAGHLLQRRFDTLSGGEQARVQLARIFAQLWDQKNGLILVDEPIAALDPGLQLELLDNLNYYASERGHAVVTILHDINHALASADRLLLVKNGAVQNDVMCIANPLPALEALYDISLSCAFNAQGQMFIAPMRKASGESKQVA
ncbi:ATP-binding cassette domain-containing protein [Undibacterium sp. SXout11W]|uniref:ATP-binding cassette domain-containing protein n=1 Tax=Undibacterium sp. SXout11W TaxID=3413050 RepID=UPI003BF30264